MAFFDQPGYSAGPFQTPARQGTLSKIVDGVNAISGIAGVVMKFAQLPDEIKSRKLKSIAENVALGQKISEVTGQPVPADKIGSMAKSAGYSWPQNTEATQNQAQESLAQRLMTPVADQPISYIPGPVPTTRGGQFNTMAELTGRQKQGEELAAAMPIGGYAPITGPKKKTFEEAALAGDTKAERIYLVTHQKTQAKSNPILDNKGNIIGYTEGRPFQMRAPGETPEERRSGQKEIIDYRETVREKRPSSGSTGGRGGLTKVQQEEKDYQDEKSKNPTLTRIEWRANQARAIAEGRSSGKITGQVKGAESLTTGGAAGVEIINTPTAKDVPPGTRRKDSNGVYWQNVNGVVSKVE